MLISAELRWFWRNRCPDQLHEWFFKTGFPPGGGCARTDNYLAHSDGDDIGIKERGGKAGLQVKGLVAVRRSADLNAVADYLEIWCKWTCASPGVNLLDKVTTRKRRWLRKFDTSKPDRAEIPLDAKEEPKSGYVLPEQGGNVELTRVEIFDQPQQWWTLGFEAFGELDTAPINLIRVIQPERLTLSTFVSSGSFLSYPAWLRARMAEQKVPCSP